MLMRMRLANSIPPVRERLDYIRRYRESGSERGKLGIDSPHRFERTITGNAHEIIVPRVSSERREYLPVGFLKSEVIISDAAQAIYDAPMFVFSIIASRMHITWVSLTAGRMKSDFRYSTGVCYNSFPLPDNDRKEQGRPDTLCGGHPAGARGAFSRDDRRSLRPGRHAGGLARGARAQRRGAGAHLHRPPLSRTIRSGWRSCSSFTPK